MNRYIGKTATSLPLPTLRLFMLGLLICVTFFSKSAYAEYKIATLNVARVLDESKEAQAAKTKLDASSKKARSLIESKQATVKKLREEMGAGKSDPKSAGAQRLEKETKELFEMMKAQEESLQKEFATSNKAISQTIGKVVSAYAKENGYNLVLDKGERTGGGVLFADKGFDITDEIISRINK